MQGPPKGASPYSCAEPRACRTRCVPAHGDETTDAPLSRAGSADGHAVGPAGAPAQLTDAPTGLPAAHTLALRGRPARRRRTPGATRPTAFQKKRTRSRILAGRRGCTVIANLVAPPAVATPRPRTATA